MFFYLHRTYTIPGSLWRSKKLTLSVKVFVLYSVIKHFLSKSYCCVCKTILAQQNAVVNTFFDSEVNSEVQTDLFDLSGGFFPR